MIYRKATLEDIPMISELRKRQLVDEGLTPEPNIDEELYQFFYKHLSEDRMVEWVVENDGVMIATSAIIFFELPPSFNNVKGIKGYVANMYTAPEYRKQGIASSLLERLMNEARERNVDKIFLNASEAGKPVYHKFGFRKNDAWMDIEL